MAGSDGIFSLRLVIADFYMEKPIAGIDVCYSEFRGKEIKRVPVIRIFGSNAQGQKTCMHVHGVFPYFYIPYDQKDFETLNKTMYQIAINLDKTINISLNQGSSSAQHVFKVQLVKGIPFYGYHRSEHHFLKIYMFNPRFVRRAANLLQNGAILNKSFHPHESHVPYILQFMIDYNLYGMSFLHVPLEIVKFRRNDVSEKIPFKNLKKSQILDYDVKKISCSSLEVDIGSNFILNRFQLITKTNTTHTNPGIEAIWNDEHVRRQKLAQSIDNIHDDKLNAIPPLEIPSTEERPDIPPTESEIFHRNALLNKLLALETSLLNSTQNTNQTLNCTNMSNIIPNPYNTNLNKQEKRTFNLSKILQNSVYAKECTQNENLINASVIQNHLSDNSLFEQSILMSSNNAKDVDETEKGKITEDERIFIDDTIIDEELVLSLTKNQTYITQQQDQYVPMNATLRQEDMELLDILQQLEEYNEDRIDLDSSLAPLSQSHKNFALSPQELDKETTAVAMHQPITDSDTDDEQESGDNMHDFSVSLENLDNLILKLTQSQTLSESPEPISDRNVPQVDGADDLLRTPTKAVGATVSRMSLRTPPTTPKNKCLTIDSPRRSSKTSKTGHKYTPLPLVSITRSTVKSKCISSNNIRPAKEDAADRNNLSKLSLREKLASFDIHRKTISTDRDIKDHMQAIMTEESINCKIRRSKRLANLDKTHITCALTPRRTNEKLLKVYSVNKNSRVENDKHPHVSEKLLKTKEDLGQKEATLKYSMRKIKSVATTERTNFKVSSKYKKNYSSINDDDVASSNNRVENKSSSHVSKEISRKDSEKNGSILNYNEDITSINESEDEIIVSDNEIKLSPKQLRKTPNLKRVRHSFIALNCAKRRKCSTINNISIAANSPKVDSLKEKNRMNLKNDFKLKKFTVRLRKIKKTATLGTQIEKKSPIREHLVLNTHESSQKQNELKENKLETTSILNDNDMDISKKLENLNYVLKLNFGKKVVSNEDLSRTSSVNDESTNENITDTPSKKVQTQELKINIFNGKALSVESPSLFTENSSPILTANKDLQKLKTLSRSNSLETNTCISLSSTTSNKSLLTPESKIIISPLDLPPSPDEVVKGCRKFQLPEHEFQQPFYSNPNDITKPKELGFTILQIPGNKLNDVEEFQSILGADLKGLTVWRRNKLLKIGGPEILNKYRNAQHIREYFANEKTVGITPQVNAPTRQEVKLWLKARKILKTKEKEEEEVDDLKVRNIEEDSPIKIRRQKVTMMLNACEGEADSDDGNNSLNYSSRSLMLTTPLTPTTPVVQNELLKENVKQSLTPVTTHIEKVSLKCESFIRKHNKCRLLKRVSLNKKFKEALEKASQCSSKKNSQENEIKKDSQECLVSNSQRSETSISSLTALAELERSSFIGNVQNHNISINEGFSENSTLNNTFGFKVALENLQQAKADVEFNYLTIVTLEVFVATRDDLYPNPEMDEIRCLFYAIDNSIPNDHLDIDKKLPNKACGYIMVHDCRDIVSNEGRIHGIDEDIDVTIVHTEIEALEALLGLCSRWDPDIYAGYEIEMSSWGFVIERAKYLCLNIAPLLSRVPTQKMREFVDEERESFTDLDIEMKLCGRILLDVWRLLRSEIALTSYTFENVMYHIMHKRCPYHSYQTLTEWFSSPCSRWIVIEYYLERVRGTLALLDQLDLIGRTSEMAKLIGIQFYEVLSRGSQFRVESMMLRIAKPKNLVPLSPSVQQRAHMRAPEYLPLIMEPQSRFYADPLIVLDFQSLYPSMIIAYNYCFSTCLGRVEHLGQYTPFEFGASQLRVPPAMLKKLINNELITISPCGVAFVKSSVREGILPRMLTEILDTRQMVKQSMKLHKSNSALQRILHSRQLGLKLMANVTYGYTAANFSGRMPAVEVGDTVVSKGRETLERAIKMVEANEKWNVKVVYGDTDSMFVLVPGRNRDEAFRIGEEIAEAITNENPHPVKLKLEKVYQPCILQTKKRYVGYMYETTDQKEPIYEAKGIETVRRDGCPIVAKMLEKVLRILFETADVSQIKHYVCRQFTKLLSGRANLQDLIFAKEFRGLNGYRPTACVPALELTRKWIQTDPRRIPRKGERVPFIITNGPPGVPLIRLVRHPHEVLANEGLKINALYYITKAIIPPLNRCLLLIGADVNEWFANLPRKIFLTPAFSMAIEIVACPNVKSKKSTISQFFSTTNCITDCGRQTKQGICSECSHNPTRSIIIIQSKISKIERAYFTTKHICQACCGRVGELNCDSLDCPVLFVLENKRRELQQIIHYRNLLEDMFVS